jgi:hypothetical protein
VRLRHYGAVPELVRGTDLVAIVPQMFADAVAAPRPARVEPAARSRSGL